MPGPCIFLLLLGLIVKFPRGVREGSTVSLLDSAHKPLSSSFLGLP